MINIVNAYGTSNDKSSIYGYKTWIDYWSRLKGINSNNFAICPNCLNIIDDNNKIVGAHVYICSLNYNCIYTAYVDTIFIIPICNSCNLTNKGYDRTKGGIQMCNIIQIDEKYLVLKPKKKIINLY
ncbi:hypothetical protein [Brachyspira pilosicoli]|uniref:hypothetical protein n=1 Tax=Brachyspira pilosicoli TaxID=52584 RepID=UPI003005D6B0